jgi:hypothetical protein
MGDRKVTEPQPPDGLIRLSDAARAFNEMRVYKLALGTYTAQARRNGASYFGTVRVNAERIGGRWYVARNDVDHAILVYQERQANPELRRVYVDQLEYQGWVTVVE